MAFNLAIGIKSRGAKTGATEVKNALKGVQAQARNTNKPLKETEKNIRGLGTAARAVKGAIVGLFAGVAARSLVKAADSYTKLGNQIALVTANSTQAAVVQRELFDLASRSRAPIEEIGTLYGRAALSAKELGATQGDLIKFTEGVAQALAINGSNAQEARGALIQLSQALGSGIVRAEEFNAVLEGARPVLVAVADGLDVSVAGLRQLVIDGKITSREFFDAFQSQLGNLQSQFDKTNKTIGQAGAEINNAFVEAVGTINEFSGVGNGVVEILGRLANLIRGPVVEGFIAFSLNVGQLIQDFDNLFSAIGDIARQTLGFFTESVDGSSDYAAAVGENLRSPWQSIRTVIEVATIEAASFFDKAVAGFKFFQANAAGDAAGVAAALNDIKVAEDARLTSSTAALNKRAEAEKNFQDAVQGARGKFSAADRASTLASIPTLGTGGSGEGAASVDEKAIGKIRDSVAAFNAANDPAEKFRQTIEGIQALQASAAAEGFVISQTAITAAIQEASNELTGWRDLLEEGRDLTESLLTPQEQYNASIAEFTKLLEAGAINEETFNRARKAAADTLAESSENFELMKELGQEAARNIQGAFVDLFMTAGSGLDDFADQFGQTLQTMAANFIANEAIKFLLKSAGGAIGGTAGGAIGDFAGKFDSGGTIPSGSWGIAGERGPEVVQGPAAVTSRQTTAGMMGPEIKLTNVNVSDPREALDVVQSNAGDKAVVNTIRRQSAAIKRELGLQ